MLHEDFATNNQQTCDQNSEINQPTNNQGSTGSSTSTSSTSRACARAREDGEIRSPCEPPELPPIERLYQTRRIYEDNIGPMPPAVGHMIERYLLNGMAIEVIEEAIGQTGWAPRPSANYLAAILRRWMRDGIKDLGALIKDQARHEAEKEERLARRAAKWYQEDSYDPLPW